jgi:hypothetical protein
MFLFILQQQVLLLQVPPSLLLIQQVFHLVWLFNVTAVQELLHLHHCCQRAFCYYIYSSSSPTSALTGGATIVTATATGLSYTTPVLTTVGTVFYSITVGCEFGGTDVQST